MKETFDLLLLSEKQRANLQVLSSMMTTIHEEVQPDGCRTAKNTAGLSEQVW